MAAKSKEMELAIKIAGKIDKSFNTALKGATNAIRGTAKAMAAGAAAAAVAVGALTLKAVNVGKEFEASMSQVSATLQIDKTTEEGAAQLAMLEEAARQCGRETAFSAAEAAGGLNELAMAGYDAAESATALPTVLRLAGAGAIEMADSARYITAGLASLGLDRTEENFNHFADVLAITASSAKTNVSQIGEAITTLGGTGQGLKGGVNEIAAALGILANADITGSEGGTHLRNLILALQNPRNKNAAEMFEQLGVSAYDSEGKMRGLNEIFSDLNTAMAGMSDAEKNSAIATMFKQTDLAAARAMLAGCGEEYDNLYEAAVNASDGLGAAQEMYNRQQDNLEGDIAILKSALSDVGISVYKNLQPALRGTTQFASEVVTAFNSAFKEGDLDGGISAVLDLVLGKLGELPEGFRQAGAAAAVFGAVGIFDKVLNSKAWQAGVSGLQKFGSAAKAFPTKFPVMLDSAKKSLGKFIPYGIASKFTGAFGKMSGAVKGFGQGAAAKASQVWNNFAGDSVLGKIVGWTSGAISKLTGFLGQVGKIVLGVGGKLVGGLQMMMGMALKMLLPAAMIGAILVGLGLLQEKFGEQINGILAYAREQGPQIIQNLTNGIVSRIPSLIAQGAALVTNFLNTLGVLAPSLVAAGAMIIIALVTGVAQNAPQMITGAISAVGGFASGILTALPSLITAGMYLLLGLVTGIAQNLPRMAEGAVSAVLSFAQGFISNLPVILAIAGQIIMALVTGIASALPVLASGALQIIGTLGQGLLANLPLIIQTGVQVIAAIAAGIVSGIGTLLGMVPQLFDMLVNTIMNTDWKAVGSDIISAIGNGIAGGAKGVWENIKAAVTGGGKEDMGAGEKAPSTPSVSGSGRSFEAPQTPSPATYQAAGMQASSAYAIGFQSGAPQITSAVQTAINGSASGAGQDAWTQAAQQGATSFMNGLDASFAGYSFNTAGIGIDNDSLTTTMGAAGTAGGQAFTLSLDGSLAGYTFDPSSVGLDVSGFQSDLQTAASSGGNAFTTGLDSSLSGYSLDTSSIGIDSSSLVTTMTDAGTTGGQVFTDSITAALGSGSFDIASAANIDTGSISTVMTEAGNAGGEAFTSSLSSSISAFSFDPSTLGVSAGVMQGYMEPVGNAGGQALTSGLASAITSGTGAVVGAASRLARGVSNAISSGFNRAKSSASSAMSSIHSICSSGAKRAANAVKNAFEHMTIKIPKPKIPVIHVSYSTVSAGGTNVQIPKFSVSYHALGGIFDQATLLQGRNGGAHVVGESGPEAILPLDTLWTKMKQILAQVMSGNGTGLIDSLLQKLQSVGRSGSGSPQPAAAGAGGGNIYFSPTYYLSGTASREDAERAGKASFEDFKKFMQQYERERDRKKF